MSVIFAKVNRQQTRDLILSLSGGSLSESDQIALDACTTPASNLWVGTIDDNPVCAWGLVPPTLLSDSAYLWLYSTDAVEEHKFMFVRYSQLVITEMRKLYPLIHGVCRVSQPKSIRWLKWLGARFGEPNGKLVPFYIGGN